MTVTATTSALAPATIGARVVALVLDAIFLGICRLVVGSVLSDASIGAGIARAVIFAAIGFAYFGYTWTAWRASPGQRVLGLMTVNAADGATLTWNQATMRWAYLFGPTVLNSLFGNQISGGLDALVSLVILGYYIYLLYTAATDPKRQGFHDRQTGTLVAMRTPA